MILSLVLCWIAFAFLVGILGLRRNLSFSRSFICSLLLTPFIGMLYVFYSDGKITDKSGALINGEMIYLSTLSDQENNEAFSQELRSLEHLLDFEQISIIDYEDRKNKLKRKYKKEKPSFFARNI